MLQIGLLVFPNITQLDMTGPYEVFIRFPDAKVHLVWKDTAPITAGGGMQLLPTTTFADAPQFDILCVPGGEGMNPLLNDDETLEFVRAQAQGAKYLTSVCTGALVLGAAGLLKGRKATTHWMSHDLLAQFGALPVNERVVVDGNILTGGGVTAGIDFALVLASEMFGKDTAERIQLAIEYDPAPPVESGSPKSAAPELVSDLRTAAHKRQAARIEAVKAAADRIA